MWRVLSPAWRAGGVLMLSASHTTLPPPVLSRPPLFPPPSLRRAQSTQESLQAAQATALMRTADHGDNTRSAEAEIGKQQQQQVTR